MAPKLLTSITAKQARGLMKAREASVRSYFRRVSAAQGFDLTASVDESPQPGPGLSPRFAEATKRALDKLAKDLPLETEEQFVTEAIILPDKRPAIRIVDGTFRVDHPLWMHFQSDPKIRARITRVLASVGRLDLPRHPSLPYGGTAFVVGDGLLMTNRHVAELFVSGLGTRNLLFRGDWGAGIDFKREQPEDLTSLISVRRVAMIHPFWDMALLVVDGLGPQHQPIKLSLDPPTALQNREVAVIGYPAFDPRNDPAIQNQVFGGVYNVKRLQPGLAGMRLGVESFGKIVSALTHDSSTLGGNSGSIVLDTTTGNAVALHFGGIYLKHNFGVPAAELGLDARVVDTGVHFDRTPSPGQTPWDRWWQELEGEEMGAMPRREARDTGRSVAGDVATWSIPLEIQVRVGNPSQVGAVEPAIAAAEITEKMVEPIHDEDLSDRTGYDRDFLGVSLPLPTVTQNNIAAPLIAGGHELKYHHFSIVMHRTRRMALFTASNIDCDETVRRPEDGRDYSRKGLSGLGPNDQEKWFPDLRLHGRYQLPDRFFSKDSGAFDKGHLVRREDVAWGDTYEEIRAANGDTYHTTNCSPQVAGFNRSSDGEENWGDLENYVLAQAKTQRLSLIAGPVLASGDPTFIGVDDDGPVRVQIPARYWKVVLAVADGVLQSYAFVLEQDLADVPLELVIDAVWQQHMVSIAELETMLSIRFPQTVHDADQSGTMNGESVRSAAGVSLRSSLRSPS